MPYTCPNVIVIDASKAVVRIQTSSSLNRRADQQMAAPTHLKVKSNPYAGNSAMIVCNIIVNSTNVTEK
jgi:hypothetical protein